MLNQFQFNERIRQILLLAVIIFVGIALISSLSTFIPGILGAFTLYILARKKYFNLIYQKKWKKGLTALAYLIGFLAIIALPIYFSITLISPKISELVNNQDQIVIKLKELAANLKQLTGIELISPQSTQNLTQKISGMVPKLLNSTLSIITNLATMFFLFYYMLVNGSAMEKALGKIIPLQKDSVNDLAKETRMMVRANAIGIPVISLIQGVVAAIGYLIFGVQDWGMWGFVTGVFAFFPVVGTMIVWVPLVISILAAGHTGPGVGLAIYSLLVTGNVDYLARMTLMKRMGDVHPVVTVLGVIVGLTLFGFIGLIFGPLLVSYFIILVKIYSKEFSASKGEIATAEQIKREAEKIDVADASG